MQKLHKNGSLSNQAFSYEGSSLNEEKVVGVVGTYV